MTKARFWLTLEASPGIKTVAVGLGPPNRGPAGECAFPDSKSNR
jgi:hypothetical protein